MNNCNSIKINNQGGFTLVELLVVISIIGLLSSFAIVSLNSARLKARDALRKGDMAQLRTALDIYYDNNLAYPICDSGNWDPLDPHFGSTIDNGSDCYRDVVGIELSDPLAPIMMDIPQDPKNYTNETTSENPAEGHDLLLYRYISDPVGQQYALIYYLETDLSAPRLIRGF